MAKMLQKACCPRFAYKESVDNCAMSESTVKFEDVEYTLCSTGTTLFFLPRFPAEIALADFHNLAVTAHGEKNRGDPS